MHIRRWCATRCANAVVDSIVYYCNISIVISIVITIPATATTAVTATVEISGIVTSINGTSPFIQTRQISIKLDLVQATTAVDVLIVIVIAVGYAAGVFRRCVV